MRTIMLGLAAAGLLAGCSGDTAPKPEEEVQAAALQPGEYAITAKIDGIHSTDKTTPAIKAKAGDPPTNRRACVAADGIAAEAFADAGDKCTTSSSYLRNGRLSLQLSCSRPGRGQVMQLADGNFKADSFEAKLTTATYFAGPGDYAMTRTLTGKRVGECPAASAKSETGKAKG